MYNAIQVSLSYFSPEERNTMLLKELEKQAPRHALIKVLFDMKKDFEQSGKTDDNFLDIRKTWLNKVLSRLNENFKKQKDNIIYAEIITVLQTFSADEKTALLIEEIKKGKNANHSLIKELLNSGVNIHVTDETGTSALIYALNSRFIKGIPSNENGVHISNLWLYFGSIHAKNKDGSDAMKYSDFTFINELFKSKVHNWPSKIKKYSQKEKDFLNNAIAEDVQAYKFFKKKWLEEELERTQRSLEDDRYDRSLQKKWLELYQQELTNLEKN